MPLMLRDIVREVLAPEPDLAVVGEFPASTDLRTAVEQTDAGVVVVGAEAAGLPAIRTLLAEHPHVNVLAVASDARDGVVYRLTPARVAIGDVSPGSLLQAIREAAASDPFDEAQPAWRAAIESRKGGA
jgi:DNA-binding NarL/FixJ family response regulator